MRAGLFPTMVIISAMQVWGAWDAQANLPVEHDCVITPRLTLHVGSPANGILDEVLVDRGDTVTEGQVLARLRSDVERVQVELARVRATSDVALESSRDRLTYFQSRDERSSTLLERDVISAEARERAQTELILARSEVRTAELEKQIAILEHERARAALELRTIRSPAAGVIIERHLGPSESVHDQAKVVTIAVVDTLFVDAYLPIESYPQTTVGTLATVRPEAPIGGVYEAEIIVVDTVFDAASSTFGVRLALDNAEGLLPAGLKCTLDLSPSS
jgi:RND family efflux transporter MFP subunit